MALDPSHVGRSYPPTGPYLVGREKIKEFADSIGATDPVHRDVAEAKAHGFADVVAPPTFPIVFTLAAGRRVFDDPVLGIDFTRVVHGQQRFRYARPVCAGDKLSCHVVVEDILSRGGHDFVTTRTEVTTHCGELVLTAWSKLVVRGSGE
jgi:acyl dehydratase